MANYVRNKIICKKDFFNKFLLDPYSFGESEYDYCKEHKYISFNKLYNVKDVEEYFEKYGEYVYYGRFYQVKELDDNFIEVKLWTKHYYPICAIKKSIELDHSVIWYAYEENIIYISKFIWNNEKVEEYTLNIETQEFYNWYDEHILNSDEFENLNDADDDIWYFEPLESEWILWDSENLIDKYKEKYPSSEYYIWHSKLEKQDE